MTDRSFRLAFALVAAVGLLAACTSQAGSTATVTQQSATQATISVATSVTTPAGTFPLQITGTSGTLSATVQVGLVVD